jgi:ferric-dicitrate binding protein FerR (iron transport regulator)
MNASEKLTAQQRDNLVAYLDGELDEAATEEIERTLARSAEARHEVEMLTRTWELLDTLPAPKASDEFSKRTLSSIKVEDLKQSGAGWFRPGNWGRRLYPVLWGLVLIVAATAGFSVSRYGIPDESQQLVEELPLIENYNVYFDIVDVDFLQELQTSGLFDEDLKKNETSTRKKQ